MTWSSRDPALRSGSSGCGRCTSGGRTVGRLAVYLQEGARGWGETGRERLLGLERLRRAQRAPELGHRRAATGTADRDGRGWRLPGRAGRRRTGWGKGAPTPFRPDLPDRLGKGAPTPLRPGNPCAGHDAIPWFEARGWPEDGGRDARTGTRRSDSLTEPRNNVQACRWRSAVAKAARGNAYASLTLIHSILHLSGWESAAAPGQDTRGSGRAAAGS
jgi:hypothetical protein